MTYAKDIRDMIDALGETIADDDELVNALYDLVLELAEDVRYTMTLTGDFVGADICIEPGLWIRSEYGIVEFQEPDSCEEEEIAHLRPDVARGIAEVCESLFVATMPTMAMRCA